MNRIERVAIYAAVFLGGALLMSLEVSAFRIIGKTFGSALRETTAVIAVFLAAMSAGYWLGGRAGDRWPRPSSLIAALLTAALTSLCVPWLDALISPRIAASALDFSSHAFLSTTVLFAIPTLLFAAISPIAIRLSATTTGHAGSTAGSISAVSTAGSIAGSLATAFLLIDWLGSISRTVIFVGLIACATAVMVMLATLPRLAAEGSVHRQFRVYGIPGAIAIVVMLIPTMAFVRSTRLDQSLLQPSPNYQMLFVGDSAYNRITVRDWKGAVRFLSFSIGPQTRMEVADPLGPGLGYSDSFHIARLMRPSLRRVLIIGLGGGTTAKQFSHYYPDTTVDAVEVDPLVVDIAQRFFHVKPGPRLRLHVGDGRMYLKRSTEKWDLIVVDAYTTNRYGDTIPPHLTTREFMQEIAAHLNEGGVMHYHVAFGQSKLLPALQLTARSTFGSMLTAAGEIIASDVALLTDKAVIAGRAKQPPVAHLPHLQGYVAALGDAPPASSDIPMLTDDFAPVDTLARQKR